MGAGAGVDGVKVDVQGTLGMCGQGLGGGAAISQQHHASIEASARTHFPGNHFINCMCHSSEDIYRCTARALSLGMIRHWDTC